MKEELGEGLLECSCEQSNNFSHSRKRQGIDQRGFRSPISDQGFI